MNFQELEKFKVYAAENESNKIDAKTAEKALEILASSPYGKSIIAAQTKGEIKRELYYEGRARKIFDTYTLSQGEEAVFDADLDIPAVAISPEGLPNMVEVKSDRIRVETSVISALMLVRWDEAALRKFDVLEVARLRGLASIQMREDVRAYNLLKYATDNLILGEAGAQVDVASLAGTTAASNNATRVNEPTDRLSPLSIAEAIGKLRGKLLPAAVLLVNPERLADLLLFNVAIVGGNLATAGGFGIFAPSVQEEVWKSGYMGDVFGVPAYDSVVVPTTEAYVLAPKEYLGKIAIRQDVQVKTLSDPKYMGDLYGIYINEGVVMRYVKGVARIDI